MKSRLVAAALALFGSYFGLHHFYLGNTKQGRRSCWFFWTGIPWIVSMVDFARFLGMSDEEFNIRYNTMQYYNKPSFSDFGSSTLKSGSQTQKLDVADELTKLASLMDKGLITFEEFEKRKAVLLK